MKNEPITIKSFVTKDVVFYTDRCIVTTKQVINR